MNRFDKAWGILTLGLMLSLHAQAAIDTAETRDRAYRSIIDRNPFGIKPPPPPPPPPPPTNEVPKGTLKLTGLTTFGTKRAYFIWTDDKAKTNKFITLPLGAEKDGIHVLDIVDVTPQKKGLRAEKGVRVVHQGVESVMTLGVHGITNAVAVAATATIPGAGLTAVAGSVQPLGGARPGGAPPPLPTAAYGGVSSGAGSTPGVRTIPSRNVRTAPDTGTPTIYAGAGAGGVPSPLPTASASGAAPPPVPTPQPNRTYEEQVILLEAQRLANPHINFPPTPGLPPPTPPPPPGIPR